MYNIIRSITIILQKGNIMQLILTNIITVISNFIVFAAIPFIWWLIRHRKEVNFFTWLGFIKPKLQVKWWGVVIFAAAYVFLYYFDWTVFISEESMSVVNNNSAASANAFAGLGVAAIIPAFLQNFLANGVCEELLYRGFINKRLCAKFGTWPGIIITGVLFGLMHNGLYLLAGVPVGLDYHIGMFCFTGGAGLMLGALDEKVFNGSIIPSIILHGLGNFIGSMTVAF